MKPGVVGGGQILSFSNSYCNSVKNKCSPSWPTNKELFQILVSGKLPPQWRVKKFNFFYQINSPLQFALVPFAELCNLFENLSFASSTSAVQAMSYVPCWLWWNEFRLLNYVWIYKFLHVEPCFVGWDKKFSLWTSFRNSVKSYDDTFIDLLQHLPS